MAPASLGDSGDQQEGQFGEAPPGHWQMAWSHRCPGSAKVPGALAHPASARQALGIRQRPRRQSLIRIHRPRCLGPTLAASPAPNSGHRAQTGHRG